MQGGRTVDVEEQDMPMCFVLEGAIV